MSDLHKTQGSQIIGEYRLTQKLGGGGFGTVYLAEHAHEHAQVAIKILQVPLIKSEDFRDFLNETRTMIRLHHPHIIPLLDVGLSHEDFPFLVMEYASEGTLRDRHPKGTQVPIDTIAEYIDQIASALQYAHDHRIIHRDVKPENMLLRADGTLLLSDFGIAKIMEQTTLMSQQKQTGTPAYMAPEQHKGFPCFASDQYALAVVAYEWISGTRPFQGSREWLAVQHVTAPLPSLLNLLPTCPPNIEQIIFKALAKEPEQRFTTVQEFATAFRTAIQETNMAGIEMKHLPVDKPPTKESLTQQPITTTGLKHTIPSTDTPPIHSFPHTDQPIEPEISPIKHAPGQTNEPLSSNQLDTPIPSPLISTEQPRNVAKASRQLPQLRKNVLLLTSLSLTGLIILALFIGMIEVRLQSTPKTIHTVPSNHTPHNALVLNTNTVSLLGKKWTFQTDGPVESSPTVVGGVLYISSDDNSVYALDVQAGKQLWAFPTGDVVVSSPTVVNGIVYVGSGDKKVYAINALSGKQIWAFPTGDVIHSSPTVVGGVVYIGSQDGNIYAIDAVSGQQKWASYTGIPAPSSPHGPPPPPAVSSFPVVVDGVVYVGAPDNNVYAINAQSGNQKWMFPTGGFLVSTPAVTDGVVYVGTMGRPGVFDKHVYAIDAQSGNQKWVFHIPGTSSSIQQGPPQGPPTQGPMPSVSSSPTVVAGIVYIGADNSNVYALDAQSGEKKWTFHTKGPVASSPVVVNGVIYVGGLDNRDSNDTNMYAIDAESGKQKWSFQTGGSVYSTPAVVNNIVYIGSADGKVYAFGLPATAS